MIRNRKLTALAILVALSLASASSVLAAQPPAPANNVVYKCTEWEWVKFHQNGTRNIRSGHSTIKERGKDSDYKKTTLAYDRNRGYFWEYTINPTGSGGQCQEVKVSRRPIPGTDKERETVAFARCRGGMPAQRCSRSVPKN